MKRHWILTFIVGVLLSLAAMVPPSQAINVTVDQSTFILSNEGGSLISKMVAAGYGNLSLYQTLVAMRNNTNPSIAGVVTPDFMNALATCPASSEIFTHQLSQYNSAGETVAISTDGTAWDVTIFGSTYYGKPGITTLNANLDGVGTALFTSPFTSWTINGPLAGMTTTYNVFAIAWAAVPVYVASLYFPHVDTSLPWQTEIAVINTSNQTATGTLRALSNTGQPVGTEAITLPAHGRRQITVADEFTNPTTIGYIIFDTDSTAVKGYTKFYQAGVYRAAIPAIKEVNTSDIYISHIDSSALWWTGVSLVNTTSTRKDLTITFNNGQSVPYTLAANEHRAFDIASLFNNQPQPDIKSAVITNASGVIGLELFGSKGSGNQLDGLLLTDDTTSTIYYPHVASDNIWWTGIVAYNPSALAATLTITPYSAQGTALTPSTLSLAGKGKYVGLVSALGLPSQTAWLKIDSSSPITGFELFATWDGNLLAANAGGGTGARAGVFAKIEKSGWTGIAFVNTEADAASVTLTAYNDNGTVVATQVLSVDGHAKVVKYAEAIFSQDISGATYITYSSDRNVVGFQLDGSTDGTMLDGLPAM